MRKLLVGVSLAALIAGCGLLPGIGGQQVTGSFSGDWSGVDASKLRLALVGIGSDGVTNYDNQLEIKDPSLSTGYVMELPQSANEGSYRVIAYADANSNSKLDSGEELGHTCNKYLLYANGSGNKFFWVGTLQQLNVRNGWNGYDAAKGGDPYQAEFYTGYNLYLAGQCP